MSGFVYVKQQERTGMQYLRSPWIRERQTGSCLVMTVPRWKGMFERHLQHKVEKRAAGRPIITDCPLGTISPYQPHKKLFYQELEAVLRKAGRRLGTDFLQQDIGLVCETLAEAETLLPRLAAPMVWVFCQEEGKFEEQEEESPVFFSREPENISRLPAVIALTETEILKYLSKKTVLFNLTDKTFVRDYTVNDAWARFPPALVQTGMDKSVLNSVLYDLHQVDKISSLRWG